MLDLSRLTAILELASYVVVVLGIPTGIAQYIRAKRREREEWERHIFGSVTDRYIAFQHLCLDRPYLDVFDIPDAQPAQLTPTNRRRS